MKKFFAMLLSLVMILSLSVPAFAAETDNVTSTEEGSNTASKNVTASYTPSSTEDTTATITGVSITVDGTTYDSTNTSAENPATITPDTTSIVITVTGTNLNNSTENNVVLYAPGYSDIVTEEYEWSISDDGSIATYDFIDVLSNFSNATTAFEIEYSNNGQQSWIGSGVYVIYDSGSTEDTTATITGVSITVDGVEYTSGDVTITPETTSIVITVTGTNLNNGTRDNMVRYAPGCASIVTEEYEWDISDDGSIATCDFIDFLNDFSNATTAFELAYCNDYTTEQTWTGSGVYVTYDSGVAEEDKAVITGLYITVDGVEYTSGDDTAIITPYTQSIVITVTGTNLENATADNYVNYSEMVGEPLSNGSWTFGEDGTSATRNLSGNKGFFESTTTAFELAYCNDYTTEQTQTGSGVYVIYQSESVSVDITWGAMSFTYDDTVAEGATEETGWTCTDGANKITVSNNGTVTVVAKVEYTAADDYQEIAGEFDVESATLAEDASQVFTLTLSGKPNQALNDATIGSVTVTIEKAAAAQTISFILILNKTV